MADAHANFAYSTVGSAPSPGTAGTVLEVGGGDGTLFPTPPFNATVWPANTRPLKANAEIVRVTAIATDTFTVTRTQESTNVRSITAGDQIAATVTKKTLTDIEAAGGTITLFDSTLGSDTASIDTGAAGIAGGYKVLEVWILARTDEAVVRSTLNITVNNDTSSIYDLDLVRDRNGTVAGAAVVAGAAWLATVHGASGSSGYPSVIRLTIPGYADTAFWKVAEMMNATPDQTAANNEAAATTLGYRATTAISRMKIAVAGGANLKTGSRLLILAR